MNRNELISAMTSEGVTADIEKFLNDTASMAATEILFKRYKADLIGTEIGDSALMWCNENDIKDASGLIPKIKDKVNFLYMDNEFRNKVFLAMRDHEMKSWK